MSKRKSLSTNDKSTKRPRAVEEEGSDGADDLVPDVGRRSHKVIVTDVLQNPVFLCLFVGF